MTAIKKISPTTILIPREIADNPICRKLLTYRDKTVERTLREHKKASWKRDRYGDEWYEAMEAKLTMERDKCLLWGDPETGDAMTYAGMRDLLTTAFGARFEDCVEYRQVGPQKPWASVPLPLREYQEKALQALVEERHGGVEVGTGLGKSYVILHLAKHYALPTLVMAPSKSIASQLFDMLTKHLGPSEVGMYGGGKKQIDKRVTVAIYAALAKVQEGSDAYEKFRLADVLIVDESHLTPAETIDEVCMGLAANAAYRFFFSATQTRNDGAELLLKGITGPMVYRMTVADGIEKNYLADMAFKVFKVTSDAPVGNSNNPNDQTRRHLLYNPKVNALAAEIANRAFFQLGQRTLILVDELPQINALGPYLKVDYEFAHGGIPYLSSSERRRKEMGYEVRDLRDILPERFHRPDVDGAVERFNKGDLPVLVGTSAICTGTDIQMAHNLIFIQGGKSEIKFRQGVGRGTRRILGKKEHCNVVDFDVQNVPVLHRHSMNRVRIYEEILPGRVTILCPF